MAVAKLIICEVIHLRIGSRCKDDLPGVFTEGMFRLNISFTSKLLNKPRLLFETWHSM